MHVGMMTAPFADQTLETVLDFATGTGIYHLELLGNPSCLHFNSFKFDAAAAKATARVINDHGVTLSAIAYYDPTITRAKFTANIQDYAKRTIDSAAMLGVPTVCMLCGFPAEGMTKIETMREVLPKVWKPILAHARRKRINIAIENWYRTCLQGLDTFEELFKAIPDDNFGLNYDPSHLYHQQCDHLLPVSLYKDRLFHTHAKDTLVDKSKRDSMGIYGEGWWRYVIPGFGNINWGEYISHLRHNGYNDVLSIEHEDKTQTREEGFKRAAWFLDQFC